MGPGAKLFKSLLILFILYWPGFLLAQKTVYKASDISPELKKNAKAVIRENNIKFEVKSEDDATMDVTHVITVLNGNGVGNSLFVEFYDKFKKISNINATLYDGNGRKLKKISGSDIQDYSAISGFSIYEDNRVKYIDPNYRTTPFTVEYSYRVNFRGLLYFPAWNLYNDYNVSVEKSSFEVIVPENYKFRYHERNINARMKEEKKDGLISYSWDTTNLYAIKYEPFCLPVSEYTPMVISAPSDFEIDGYSGNCNTWKNFGAWINKLNEDKNFLPDETKNYLKELVKNATNDIEKIEILYDYLQNKTRYVSIQVGIGGWQPFEAEVVDRLSYGDCKALTNYMRTILEVVGVKSYYTLVYAGEKGKRLISDFPSSQFNHAFLCVPIENDTIWLECTSQHMPFGYIGTFTDDRDVLLVDEDGGKIAHTKIFTADENRQSREVNVSLDSQGNGTANIHTSYNGLFYEDIIRLLLSDDADKKKMMYEKIKIPNFELVNFNHEEIKKRIPEVKENIEIYIRDCGTLLGDRMIVNLNLMNRIDEMPKRVKDRKSDIFIRRSFVEIDTVIYSIPGNYSLDKIPQGASVTSRFGEYKTGIISNGTEVKFTRYFTLNKGIYPVSDYNDFVDFFENVINNDETKIVLTKK